MNTVLTLKAESKVPLSRLCKAFEVSRATVYRRLRMQAAGAKPCLSIKRAIHHRALSGEARARVKDLLHSKVSPVNAEVLPIMEITKSPSF